MKECKSSHDGKHKPIQKLGSKTGYICSCCREEIENVRNDKLKEAQEIIYDMFNQACQRSFDNETRRITYHHGFLSTYKNAQHYLIDNKIIKEEDCEVR